MNVHIGLRHLFLFHPGCSYLRLLAQLTCIETFDNDYGKKLGEPDKNPKKWKEAARHGVPDSHKRRFILCLFKVDPEAARNQYALVKSIAGEEFVNLTRDSRMI